MEIAYALGSPFGVQAIGGNGAPGAIFDREAIRPSQKILPFLSALARERNLVISSDEDGELFLQQEAAAPGTAPDQGQDAGSLSATFAEDESPVVSVVPNFNAQQFYSHVTAFEPVILGLVGGQHTVKNSKLGTVLRPYNFLANDTSSADIVQATEATMGRMYANAIAYTMQVSTWRNAAGRLWRPGDFITLHWPRAMIYEAFTFFVRRVNFRKDQNTETATLTLTLPGGFAGKIPESLPWD